MKPTSAALVLAFAALLVAAPSSFAATATISGDDGNPVPLTAGLGLRHMAPDIAFTFGEGEQYYSARVLGPAGAAASAGTGGCVRTDGSFAERVAYQGNGAYALAFRIGDTVEACEAAAEQSVPFAINAATSIVAPSSRPLLFRDFGTFSLNRFEVPVNLNPGAGVYEFRYAPSATVAPDGGITGESQSGFVDLTAGTATISFSEPGRYTLVVRARSSRSDAFTAWSPRLDLTVVAPFDLSSITFPDSRGPSYTLAGIVRERSATGRITISIGKGPKAKRFKRLGTAKIRKGGRFRLRFRLRRVGKYTLRYSFRGSATVARGSVVEAITIRRRVV